MKRTAFSLVELLVVVAIIALLAALLVPTLGKAKATGRMTICESNLHQIESAFRDSCSRAKTVDNSAWPGGAHYSSANYFPGVPMDSAGTNSGIFLCPDETGLSSGSALYNRFTYNCGGAQVTLDSPDSVWAHSREGSDDNGPYRDFIFEDDASGTALFSGPYDIDGACRIWQDGTVLILGTSPPEWSGGTRDNLTMCTDENILLFDGQPVVPPDGEMRNGRNQKFKVTGAGTTNYGMNTAACTSLASGTVVVADYGLTMIDPDSSFTPQRLVDSARHMGKLNVLLSDGSVTRRTPLELSPVVDMRQWKGK